MYERLVKTALNFKLYFMRSEKFGEYLYIYSLSIHSSSIYMVCMVLKLYVYA